MSDLVGNPEDRFSRVEAHIKMGHKGVYISRACYPDDGQQQHFRHFLMILHEFDYHI